MTQKKKERVDLEAQTKNKPLVYVISGKAEHGKNAVADIIQEYYKANGAKTCMLSFASTIKQYCKDYFEWDGSNKTKPREILQKMGTDIIRRELNKPLFHVSRVCEDIQVLKEWFDIFLIPDARFPNEIYYTKAQEFDVVTIRVIRTNYESTLTEEQQNHPSETALDNFKDYDHIIIASNMEELTRAVMGILKQ